MVKLAENAGFGFDKIESNWFAYNNSKPEYLVEFDSIVLKMRTEKMSGEMSGEIIAMIKHNGKVTIPEIANYLNVSSRTVERHLKRMQFNGQIKRVGSNKSGNWVVIP